MAWRFKASKYKNSVPVEPKLDKQIRDLSIGSYHSCGNYIAASATHMAFNWDTLGSSLAVLPLTASGRPDKASIPRIDGHSDTVTDFAFSPFDDGLLATGSSDQTVKLWRIPPVGYFTNITKPELVLPEQPRKVETVGFHPAAHGILATSSGTALSLWDLTTSSEIFNWEGHGDRVQSVAWQWGPGRLVATQARDKQLRILDPRAVPGSAALVGEVGSHDGVKDSKVVWVGEQRLLTSGFSADRCRELILRDMRQLSRPQHVLSLDVSAGILVPLYDLDTNMIFLSGKGDRAIQFVEVTEREPWFVEGLRYTGEQIKGACLVPKRAMDVMQCEVNRVLILGNSSIIPITWQVPRKSYREYQADIFPDTPGPEPAMGPLDWLQGGQTPPPRISLNPTQRPGGSLVKHGPPLQDIPRQMLGKGASSASALPKISAALAGAPGELTSINGAGSHSPKLGINQSSSSNGSVGATESTKRELVVETTLSAAENGLPSPAKSSSSPKPSPLPRVLSRGEMGATPTPAPRSSAAAVLQTPSSQKSAVVPQTPSNQESAVEPQTPLNRDSAAMPPPSATPSQRSVDMPDDASSSGGLRRQPSIRDRMRVFEQRGGGSVSETPSRGEPRRSVGSLPKEMTTRIEAKMDITASRLERNGNDENKENMEVVREKQQLKHPKVDEVVREEEEEEEVVLRPKIRKDANNPFVMTQSRPQGPAQPNRLSRFGRVTKFRHMKGTPLHKSKHFENLKNLSKALPAECDFIQANEDRLAVPLAGPGGKLAILEVARAGRISDGVLPAVINTGATMDFAWDPFNNNRLAVVTDEGALNLWIIPQDGLNFQVNQPASTILAHSDKVSIVKFSPTAEDVVATAAFDWTVKIWNLATAEEKLVLEGHQDQIYSLAWSQCGRFLATVCRDGKVRIYDPRAGSKPVREGGDVAAKKGARIVWALDGRFLIVSGFSKQSERQILIYETRDLSCIHTETMDVSPAILIPHYDEDSSTLFLTGKGEVTVYAYEVAEDSPYLFLLSPFKCASPTQGLAFLHHKNVLNVKDVEFARAYRLTASSIEPTSFTVPRVKSSFFQDDLFPPTRVLWEPAITAAAWFRGEQENIRYVSLQPADMPALSGSAPVGGCGGGVKSGSVLGQKQNVACLSRDEAREIGRDLSKAVGDIIELSDKLEQEGMEGVEDKEWEDEE